MEDNKYYTPTVEDFYKGFEFELLDKGKWRCSNDFVYSLSEWDVETLNMVENRIQDKEIRVKYLDKEDIGSLGWKDIGSLWFKIGDYKLRKWREQSLDIYYTYPVEKEDIMIFRGTIKNKSELKKLMQQLNINE